MKKLIFCLLLLAILLAFNDSAMGACDCRQPAYQNKIDFLTRYTACLEQCYNSQFESFKLQIDGYDQRISDLELEIDRLRGRIKELESEASGVENKKSE